MCHVRNVRGQIFADVSSKRLFLNKLDVGSRVEVRYKGMKLFYRGKVTAVFSRNLEEFYTILYDDGEKEKNVSRSMIRPTAIAVNEFVAARTLAIMSLDKRLLRLSHYKQLKAERLGRAAQSKKRYVLSFVNAWSIACSEKNPHLAPPSSSGCDSDTKSKIKTIENKRSSSPPASEARKRINTPEVCIDFI